MGTYPKREGEAPMPLRFLKQEDVDLLSTFITTHRDQITLPAVEWDELQCWNFTELAGLLRYLKNKSILTIIDFTASLVICKVDRLLLYNFGGSWLYSLRSLVVDNFPNILSQLEKVVSRMEELKTDLRLVSARLEAYKVAHKNCDNHSMDLHMLIKRIKWFEHQRKLVNSELAELTEKVKAVWDARESLKFFYST